MTTGTLGLSRPMRVFEQHTFLPAAVSFSSQVYSAQRPGRSHWGGAGGVLISRGGLLGTQHPTPEPLPSPFLLVPPATQSRISWGPSGPVLQLSEQPEPPSPQERRLEGTSACVGSSTGSSEALPAKEPCALDAG